MSELVIRLDEQLAAQLSELASHNYNGDQNAAISDALLLFFLQPLRKDRRRIARRIYEMREHAQKSGGVSESKIANLVKEYRQQKRATA